MSPGKLLRNRDLRGLRAAKKLNSGCKLLLVSIGEDERWLKTKQLLEKDFGQVRDVEAKENPYYRACEQAQKGCVSMVYDHVEQLKNLNSNKKTFAEVTVGPVRTDTALSLSSGFTNSFSEESDQQSDVALDNLVSAMISENGDEDIDFDVETMYRDLCNEENSDGVACGSSVAYHDGDNNDSCNERDPTLITTPKTTGAASAPNQLIQKVAQRIVNGEGYRTACEALSFNLNKDKEYMGYKTSDYSRLQHQVRKLKDEQRKVAVQWNERLVEQLKSVTHYLNSVLEQNRVLQEKLAKCVCGGSRKRKITYLPSSGKTKSKNDPDKAYCY